MSHDNDEYETSDPLTMGGATGNYVIPSPYHTECEWCIISALAIGTLGSAGTYAVGSKNPTQPTLNGTSTFGGVLTSGMDSNNALQSYPGALTATAPFVTYGGDNYMPLPSPAYVYATVTAPATTAVLITVQFRRKLDRPIPAKPRQKPQTHNNRTASRREHRTMMEGYAAQYPEEGKPYQHEQIPLAQDTAIGKRGVMPLGPTTITHRGVSKRNDH